MVQRDEGRDKVTERRFDDRVAVITGAGRGLGRSYAELLAAKGAKVVVNDTGASVAGDEIAADPATEVVAGIQAAGGEAVACHESVATPAGGQAIIDTALDSWGRIDILIHNAGNVRYGSLREISYDDFRAVVDVHLMGAFHVVRPAFPRMADAGYGRVVLTGSIGGIYGNANTVNYGVSKAGTIGLSNSVAIEGKEFGIKSNVILPGAVTRLSDGIDTSQFPPMGPELVAPVVGWLAHETCSVSGELLISVGGRVARAYIAESEGIYQPEWSIEEVAEKIEAIRTSETPWVLAPADGAFGEHLGRSFAMTRGDT